MTPKAKHPRQKNREIAAAKILEAARGTNMSGNEKPLIYQWHDGTLVHRVVKDCRHFYVIWHNNTTWMSRTVWATFCNYVIAIDLSKFISTGKAPTCVRCVVGRNSFYIGIDWASVAKGLP